MSTTDLSRRAREAKAALSEDASSTSAVDNYKEELENVTFDIQDVVLALGPAVSQPSGTRSLQYDTTGVEEYLQEEERILEKLIMPGGCASLQFDGKPRFTADCSNAIPDALLNLLDTCVFVKKPSRIRKGSSETSLTIPQTLISDDLDRELHVFQNVFVDHLWNSIVENNGETARSSDAMKSLEKQVERFRIVIHLNILQARCRQLVASAQSRHDALVKQLTSVEEQNVRLEWLGQVQDRHYNNIVQALSMMTELEKLLSAVERNHGLMQSHLYGLAEERSAAAHSERKCWPSVQTRDFRKTDFGPEADVYLKRRQDALVSLAEDIKKAEGNEVSCRESLAKALRDVKKEKGEEISRAQMYLQKVQALHMQQMERFKHKLFVYFYRQPEKLQRISQLCEKEASTRH